jgi:site-specific recombinase XerD
MIAEITKVETSLDAAMTDLAGQLAPRSRRIYESDAKAFANWLIERGLTPTLLTRSHMIAYRAYLADKYAKATANRMMSVARRLLTEQVYSGKLTANPGSNIKGFTVDNETPHRALKKEEARELVDSVDQTTCKGKRDYTILLLLLKTGIRRDECAALKIGDLVMREGHHVLFVRHGKGDKRRIVKLQVEVYRTIMDYLSITGRDQAVPSAPLFTQMIKGDKVTEEGISDKLVERVVKQYAANLPDFTPHGARASFITLSLEGGASLYQVQYAAGHSDPRTTERYQKRKLNLDDNATDYVKF